MSEILNDCAKERQTGASEPVARPPDRRRRRLSMPLSLPLLGLIASYFPSAADDSAASPLTSLGGGSSSGGFSLSASPPPLSTPLAFLCAHRDCRRAVELLPQGCVLPPRGGLILRVVVPHHYYHQPQQLYSFLRMGDGVTSRRVRSATAAGVSEASIFYTKHGNYYFSNARGAVMCETDARTQPHSLHVKSTKAERVANTFAGGSHHRPAEHGDNAVERTHDDGMDAGRRGGGESNNSNNEEKRGVGRSEGTTAMTTTTTVNSEKRIARVSSASAAAVAIRRGNANAGDAHTPERDQCRRGSTGQNCLSPSLPLYPRAGFTASAAVCSHHTQGNRMAVAAAAPVMGGTSPNSSSSSLSISASPPSPSFYPHLRYKLTPAPAVLVVISRNVVLKRITTTTPSATAAPPTPPLPPAYSPPPPPINSSNSGAGGTFPSAVAASSSISHPTYSLSCSLPPQASPPPPPSSKISIKENEQHPTEHCTQVPNSPSFLSSQRYSLSSSPAPPPRPAAAAAAGSSSCLVSLPCVPLHSQRDITGNENMTLEALRRALWWVHASAELPLSVSFLNYGPGQLEALSDLLNEDQPVPVQEHLSHEEAEGEGRDGGGSRGGDDTARVAEMDNTRGTTRDTTLGLAACLRDQVAEVSIRGKVVAPIVATSSTTATREAAGGGGDTYPEESNKDGACGEARASAAGDVVPATTSAVASANTVAKLLAPYSRVRAVSIANSNVTWQQLQGLPRVCRDVVKLSLPMNSHVTSTRFLGPSTPSVSSSSFADTFTAATTPTTTPTTATTMVATTKTYAMAMHEAEMKGVEDSSSQLQQSQQRAAVTVAPNIEIFLGESPLEVSLPHITRVFNGGTTTTSFYRPGGGAGSWGVLRMGGSGDELEGLSALGPVAYLTDAPSDGERGWDTERPASTDLGFGATHGRPVPCWHGVEEEEASANVDGRRAEGVHSFEVVVARGESRPKGEEAEATTLPVGRAQYPRLLGDAAEHGHSRSHTGEQCVPGRTGYREKDDDTSVRGKCTTLASTAIMKASAQEEDKRRRSTGLKKKKKAEEQRPSYWADTLQELDLSYTSITDADAAHDFPTLTCLCVLSLQGCSALKRTSTWAPRMHVLSELDLSYTAISAHEFYGLGQCPTLQVLRLDHCSAFADVLWLVEVPRLRATETEPPHRGAVARGGDGGGRARPPLQAGDALGAATGAVVRHIYSTNSSGSGGVRGGHENAVFISHRTHDATTVFTLIPPEASTAAGVAAAARAPRPCLLTSQEARERYPLCRVLRELYADGSGLTSEGLTALFYFAELEVVSIQKCVGVTDVTPVRDLHCLEVLNVNGTSVHSSGSSSNSRRRDGVVVGAAGRATLVGPMGREGAAAGVSADGLQAVHECAVLQKLSCRDCASLRSVPVLPLNTLVEADFCNCVNLAATAIHEGCFTGDRYLVGVEDDMDEGQDDNKNPPRGQVPRPRIPLQRLSLRSCDAIRDVAGLRPLSSLLELDLYHTQVDALQLVKALRRWDSLRVLHLGSTPVTDLSAWVLLATSTQEPFGSASSTSTSPAASRPLSSSSLSPPPAFSNVDPSGALSSTMKVIASPPPFLAVLRFVDLSNTAITTHGLAFVTACSSLESLLLRRCPLVTSLRFLCTSPHDFVTTTATSMATAAMAMEEESGTERWIRSSLRELVLTDAENLTSAEAMPYLRCCQALEHLSLARCKNVTCVAPLRSLRLLQTLDLTATTVTDEALGVWMYGGARKGGRQDDCGATDGEAVVQDCCVSLRRLWLRSCPKVTASGTPVETLAVHLSSLEEVNLNGVTTHFIRR